jgi:hypothetical protein
MKNISTQMLEKYNRQLAKATAPAEKERIKKKIFDFLYRVGKRNKRKQLVR